MRALILLSIIIGSMRAALPPARASQQGTCNAPSKDPTLELEVPGSPFEPVITPDGCWIFVTLTDGGVQVPGRMAVVRRDSGAMRVVRVVELKGNPTGAVLTHDGQVLIVADGGFIAFLDALKLTSGEGDPVLGYIGQGAPMGFINVNVTRDDRLVFVSAERAQSIVVVNLVRARANGFDERAIVGRIPVGNAPIALTFSPDEKLVYTTSEGAPPSWNWPRDCRAEQASSPRRQVPARGRVLLPPAQPNHPKGAVLVVSVDSATVHPASAVISTVAAGCEPVRLVLSPDGATAYVSARGDDELLAFDTRRLVSDTAHALLGRVDVGLAPVGLAVADSGRRVFVTNSNRFEGNSSDRQPIAIVDAARLAGGGARAKLGTVQAGAFPRELRVSADGRTLFVTNFASHTLEMIDLARVR